MKIKEYENRECVKNVGIVIDFATGAKVYRNFKALPKKFLEADVLRQGTYGTTHYAFVIAEC